MADKKLIEYYRARAAEYEQIYYRDNPPRRQEIEDEKLRLMKLVSQKRVLELACGTGYWTEVMSRTAKGIVAVDISPEMIEEAKEKSYRCNVEFRHGDISNPIDDSTEVDVMALGFWFSHQPKQEYSSFFRNLLVTLSPEGRIWMIDNNPPAEGPELHSVRTDGHGNSFKRRRLDNGNEHIILKNYFTQSQLRDLLVPHFEIERLTFGVYYWSVVMSRRL